MESRSKSNSIQIPKIQYFDKKSLKKDKKARKLFFTKRSSINNK